MAALDVEEESVLTAIFADSFPGAYNFEGHLNENLVSLPTITTNTFIIYLFDKVEIIV